MNFIELNSVGSIVDEFGSVFPQDISEAPVTASDAEELMGVNVFETTDEWIENLSVDDYKLYMAKVLKRNAAKFSFVSDEDDAATMAELALRPLFVGLNGQKISYPIKLKSGAEGNLTYELAVEIFAKIIYESM